MDARTAAEGRREKDMAELTRQIHEIVEKYENAIRK